MEPRIDEEPAIVRPGPEDPSLLTRQQNHRSEEIWNGEDPGPLKCRGRAKEMEHITMQDNRVIDIIKLVGLERLFRAPSREIDHCLISALVERWRPETHTFHLPHGEMSITLEDVEVILGLPIDGEVLVGPTTVVDGDWRQLCVALLGFEVPANDNKILLYRELCRASEKEASQIGGALQLVQYWAWARLPFLCPRIEPPLGCDYGPWPKAPLTFKWVRVPSPKSRPSATALIHYCEQLVRMQLGQIMWQPYEADFGHLPDFCVVGRDMWTARVPLGCFCIVETHHPDRVVRQFGLAQERPDYVVYDDRLHRIDLRGKVEKNWREKHGPYILTWDMRQQRLCHAPLQTGEMPRDHAYYRWYRPVTRKYVDRNSAKLDIMIESHLALLAMLPIGSREHNHVQHVLSNVVGLGGVLAPNGEANNGQENEPTAIATLSTSTTLLIPPTRGQRATASPSTSAARGRGRPATASPSPSTSAARGRGRLATASPSTSAATGRGQRATTRGVVTSPGIPAPIPHASPQPEVHPPIPDASPQFEVPPPMVDASLQPEVPSPTPPSQPSFDLGIPLHLTPPMHPETSSYPPTSSSAPTLPIDTPRTEPMTMIPTPSLYTEHHYPPTLSSSAPLGPLVGIDTVHPDTDVSDEHPPHQPSPLRGRSQRTRRAPTCGTGGHKIGHKGSSMVITMYVVKTHLRKEDDSVVIVWRDEGCDDANIHHMTLIQGPQEEEKEVKRLD
ncbi:hypothetical protein SO802_017470 [Lithocarpus litseifolius]|uniref:Aminotransferase-like plant mobile domain-containing protein n=1 Tax=Lithocarpus litseifolius TaxID=425828 RepID=A0AAW2CJZ1_9ROSI